MRTDRANVYARCRPAVTISRRAVAGLHQTCGRGQIEPVSEPKQIHGDPVGNAGEPRDRAALFPAEAWL